MKGLLFFLAGFNVFLAVYCLSTSNGLGISLFSGCFAIVAACVISYVAGAYES